MDSNRDGNDSVAQNGIAGRGDTEVSARERYARAWFEYFEAGRNGYAPMDEHPDVAPAWWHSEKERAR